MLAKFRYLIFGIAGMFLLASISTSGSITYARKELSIDWAGLTVAILDRAKLILVYGCDLGIQVLGFLKTYGAILIDWAIKLIGGI